MSLPPPLAHLPRGACLLVWDDEGRLLTVTRRHGRTRCWPGGRQDPGEDLATTARRELMEEAGVAVEHMVPLWAGVDGPSEEGTWYWVQAYLGWGLVGTPRCCEKGVEPAWLSPEAFQAQAQFPDYVRKVLRVCQEVRWPGRRAQVSGGF